MSTYRSRIRASSESGRCSLGSGRSVLAAICQAVAATESSPRRLVTTSPRTASRSPMSTSDLKSASDSSPTSASDEHHLDLGAVALAEPGEAELAGVAQEDHPAGDRDCRPCGCRARARRSRAGGRGPRGSPGSCACARRRWGRPARPESSSRCRFSRPDPHLLRQVVHSPLAGWRASRVRGRESRWRDGSGASVMAPRLATSTPPRRARVPPDGAHPAPVSRRTAAHPAPVSRRTAPPGQVLTDSWWHPGWTTRARNPPTLHPVSMQAPLAGTRLPAAARSSVHVRATHWRRCVCSRRGPRRLLDAGPPAAPAQGRLRRGPGLRHPAAPCRGRCSWWSVRRAGWSPTMSAGWLAGAEIIRLPPSADLLPPATDRVRHGLTTTGCATELRRQRRTRSTDAARHSLDADVAVLVVRPRCARH